LNDLILRLINILYAIPCVLLALTVHEVAHGWIALKLGDPTARNLGRLTLNPLKHLDPIGALCMLLFRFGWARPVPINSRYFKKPRRDMALTALAGPVSNILMGLAGVLLYAVVAKIFLQNPAANDFAYQLQLSTMQLLSTFFSLNLSLAVFNFLPVPPLDGSRIFLVFLPPKLYFGVMQYERYIQIGLLICLYLGLLDGILSFLVNGLITVMFRLVQLLPFL